MPEPTCASEQFPQAALDAMVHAAREPRHDDGHTDCYYAGLLAAALPHLVVAEETLRADLATERKRVVALWSALCDIKATCDGRVAGESRRASYLGISNYIRRVLATHAPIPALGEEDHR